MSIQITGEKIEKIREYFDEIDELKVKTSDAIKLAKANSDKDIALKRRDGKVSMLTEGLLWEEVRVMSRATEAYDVLRNKYPEAFLAGEAEQNKGAEMKKYVHMELGIDPLQMSLRDIINLMVAVCDYKLGQQPDPNAK